MKKYLLALVVMAAFSTAGFSQVQRKRATSDSARTPAANEHDAAMRRERFRNADLDSAQQLKMQQLDVQRKESRKKIMDDTTLTPDQKKAKLMELRQKQMQEAKEVLTPEQQAKMRAARAQQVNP